MKTSIQDNSFVLNETSCSRITELFDEYENFFRSRIIVYSCNHNCLLTFRIVDVVLLFRNWFLLLKCIFIILQQ